MPSEKILNEKKAEVSKIADKFKASVSIVFVDHRGLTVEEDTELRGALRKAGIEYKVTKNTLASLAAEEAGIKGVEAYFKGPTAIATSGTDLTAAAKILSDFSKKHQALEIKGGYVDGTVIDEKGVKILAELPSREVLIAKVLGGFNAPITGLVNVLNGNIRGLAIVLNAIAEKKSA
ncbi:MAG: 50S ribosomal protein L10 [Clostridiales bacterium]|nr:50S ribosomal protein L10 [Clostridiales bacterium]